MNRTIHILSVHYENPFWIDIQLKQLKKHLRQEIYFLFAIMLNDTMPTRNMISYKKKALKKKRFYMYIFSLDLNMRDYNITNIKDR